MTAPTRPKHKGPHQRGINAAIARQRRVRTAWIAGGIAVVVAVALVLAFAFGGGDDGAGSGDTTGGTLAQTQPVTITGDGLPAYDRKASTDVALGTKAPQVVGKSFDGTDVSITPGKPTMVVFLAHWCPHCQAEVPRLVEWYGQGHTPKDLDVIAVATGTDKSQSNYPPSAWLVEEQWPWKVLADDDESSAMAAYGFINFPAFALIDSDGMVRFRATGEIAMSDLDAAILASLGLE